MRIHWENIDWETDDGGTSWATLADEEHNSLTLENRDDTITFHTDGNPTFDASTVLDIVALCVILFRDAIGQASRPRQGRATGRRPRARADGPLVPGQRRTSLPDRQPIDPKASR